MDKVTFEKIVRKAVAAMPASLRRRLENVEICVAARPTARQKRSCGVRSCDALLGLYEGVPRIRRDSGYGPALPDKITLFQAEIQSVAPSAQDLPRIIQETVWHEFAHHFGFEEDDLDKYAGPP